METYILTIWLLWPKVAAVGQPSEIVRHVLDSLESCQAVAAYYLATVAADGVDSLAWTCTLQLAV